MLASMYVQNFLHIGLDHGPPAARLSATGVPSEGLRRLGGPFGRWVTGPGEQSPGGAGAVAKACRPEGTAPRQTAGSRTLTLPHLGHPLEGNFQTTCCVPLRF